MHYGGSFSRWTIAGVSIISALALAACGSSKKSSSSASSPSSTSAPTGTLSLSITESGKAARYTAPPSATGGLVTLTLRNDGKIPHSAQLILMEGNHTLGEVLKQLYSNSPKTPSWMRAEGGVAITPPGQTGTATVNLPAGRYALTELPNPASPGPGASTELQVAPGQAGSLPAAPTTVTAATAGKDKYKWDISGPLKPGTNAVTFESKGADAIHLITAVRIVGNPTKAEIIKGLESNGGPPRFVDPTTLTETAVLDGGKAAVTQLNLAGPGRYILFCPLTDRDGGKPHFAEGLLTTVAVK